MASPLFFTESKERAFQGALLETRTPDALPVAQYMGRFKQPESSIPTSNLTHLHGDIATVVKNVLPAGVVGGTSFLVTSPMYGPIGAFDAKCHFSRMKECKRIGDEEGVAIEMRETAASVALATGSIVSEAGRMGGIAADFNLVIHHTAQLSPATTAVANVFSWFSAILFSIYYTFFSYRIVEGFVHLGRGKDLREELLSAEDPVKAFKKKMDDELAKVWLRPQEALEAIALEEGAIWLKRVAKEAKKQGKSVEWTLSEKGIREFLEAHPEHMRVEMGEAPDYITREFNLNELARFGAHMAQKRLSAKLEVGYSRLLGADAVTAAKEKDAAKFKELLISPSWKKNAVKLALALIGLTATIVGTALTGGTLLWVVLILYGISAIVWIALWDAAAFKAQWDSNEVKKRDKWFVAASVVLSLLALGGLISLAVISGGAPIYLIGIILTSAWLITNCRALGAVLRREMRPWDYHKIPTAEMFRKLTEKNPAPEKIDEILKKMSKYNQDNLRRLHQGDWQKAARYWEEHVKKTEEAAFDVLLEELKAAGLIR